MQGTPAIEGPCCRWSGLEPDVDGVHGATVASLGNVEAIVRSTGGSTTGAGI